MSAAKANLKVRRTDRDGVTRVLSGGPLHGATVYMTTGLDGTLPVCAAPSGCVHPQCGHYDSTGGWHAK